MKKMNPPQCGCGDAFLLRWGVLSAAALALTVLAQALGLFAACGTELLRVLALPPFYVPAESLHPLLGRGALFGLSVVLVLYGGAVLLRAGSRGRACALWLPMAVAAALPTFVAALWDGYLNLAAPVFSLTMAALLRLAVPFFQYPR